MKSKNYRQLLKNEFEAKEMTKEDFDNTLMHFAMLYHKEQLKLYDVVSILPSKDEKLILNMCLSFRHDFSLLPKLIQDDLKRDCKNWLIAYENNRS